MKDIDYYMNRRYFACARPDSYTTGEICWYAWHPDLPGCASSGDTINEAFMNLDSARRDYIEAMLEWGVEVHEGMPLDLPLTVGTTP